MAKDFNMAEFKKKTLAKNPKWLQDINNAKMTQKQKEIAIANALTDLAMTERAKANKKK